MTIHNRGNTDQTLVLRTSSNSEPLESKELELPPQTSKEYSFNFNKAGNYLQNRTLF